jgi:hypothetical protein
MKTERKEKVIRLLRKRRKTEINNYLLRRFPGIASLSFRKPWVKDKVKRWEVNRFVVIQQREGAGAVFVSS